MGRWAAKVFGFSFGIVFRFTECPFRQGSVARKVSTDSGTNENPPITHRHIDTSTRVHKTRHKVRLEDRRQPKGARGPVRSRLCWECPWRCVGGQFAATKAEKKFEEIGIRLATGTGSPWSICIMRSGMGKLQKQAAARGRLVGQRRIAGMMG